MIRAQPSRYRRASEELKALRAYWQPANPRLSTIAANSSRALYRRSCVRVSVLELFRLWDRQNGRCGLTGRLLTTGTNEAHLDHIVPLHRGGGSTVDNLRWVCRAANVAKHTLLDSELNDLCREILAHV